jgi:hypothetical protein
MHFNNSSSIPRETPAIIIGGGLSGILCAIRLAKEGISCILIDSSLPDAKGKLGGFARFCGGKFSPLPAGIGLIRAAGTQERLIDVTKTVIDVLGLTKKAVSVNIAIEEDIRLNNSLSFRKYDSILLNVLEMDSLINRISTFPPDVTVCRASCFKIHNSGSSWDVSICMAANGEEKLVKANTIFFAGGRNGASILTNNGFASIEGKGIDLGVRIEVNDPKSIASLKSLGADAKVLWNNCRTFCLNCPGEIYWYSHDNLKIAGGIMADESCSFANVGLLYREKEKSAVLNKLLKEINYLTSINEYKSSYEIKGKDFGIVNKVLERIFGVIPAGVLNEFKIRLGDSGLVDWNSVHTIHLPLLDWYWPTFCSNQSFQTSIPNSYVIGDAAGFARGLLQAAVSGWLAAEEFIK